MNQALANYRSLRRPGWLDQLKLACFLVLVACRSVEPIEKNLFFVGAITDAATTAPMAGTTIFVGDGTGFVPTNVQSTTSDSQGRYTLAHFGCINNPYVFVSATGYYSDQAKVGCNPDTQTLNFALIRNPSAP